MRATKLLVIMLIALLGSATIKKANAQQEPLYTQYMFNTLSVNPAYTGTTNALNILALSRIQWVGIKGAPRTYTFAIHTPLNEKRAGVGLSIVSDEIGPVKNFYLSGSYAYRIKVSEGTTLSLGLKGGFYSYSVNLSNLNISQVNDPSFQQNQVKKIHPNMGFGAYYYSNQWYAGLAIPKLFENDLSKQIASANTLSELKRHYYLIAGYVVKINNDLAFKPSFVEKVVAGAPLSTDITAQLFYKERFWLGTSYRIGDALAFLFEVKLNDQLMLGYSYDITLSQLSGYSYGSHEILLSFDFDKFSSKKVKSPRYF
jgi:type IX secretion system PorP/SprF family membrane protein